VQCKSNGCALAFCAADKAPNSATANNLNALLFIA
jgi:hypothetical protein